MAEEKRKMNISEAVNTLTHFGNVFKATQEIIEVLEIARQVEGNKAGHDEELRQLEAARAKVAKQREAVEAEVAKLDEELANLRSKTAQDLAAVLDDEKLKREGIMRQTEAMLAGETKRREEIEQITAGMQTQRDALAKEIHQLEDRRDELKGIPIMAQSSQVRLPHE